MKQSKVIEHRPDCDCQCETEANIDKRAQRLLGDAFDALDASIRLCDDLMCHWMNNKDKRAKRMEQAANKLEEIQKLLNPLSENDDIMMIL